MSRTTRTIAIAGAALALAITAFVLLRPGDDEESTPATTATTTTTGAAPAAGTTTATTADPGPKTTIIRLKDGSPVGGKSEIEVSKGDRVRLTVTSDTPDDIHVHGYDIEKPASPGSPARFRFTADIEGRFEVESHVADTQIAEITVNP